MNVGKRTDTNGKKIDGILSGIPLSDEWITKYLDERRQMIPLKKTRRPRQRNLVKQKIAALEAAQKVHRRIGPLLPWQEKGHLETTLQGLSLAIDHLSTLTNPGRILKPEIPATIFFLTELYRTHTGTPHYFEVGLLVSKHFRDVLPRKVVDGDVTEWVRKTATRYACILEQLCGDNKRVDSVLKRLGKSRLLESLHP